MPEALPEGYILHADNLSYTDSIEIAVQRIPIPLRRIGTGSHQRRQTIQILPDRCRR